MVEHPAVNRRVAGSSPARGAKNFPYPFFPTNFPLNVKYNISNFLLSST